MLLTKAWNIIVATDLCKHLFSSSLIYHSFVTVIGGKMCSYTGTKRSPVVQTKWILMARNARTRTTMIAAARRLRQTVTEENNRRE